MKTVPDTFCKCFKKKNKIIFLKRHHCTTLSPPHQFIVLVLPLSQALAQPGVSPLFPQKEERVSELRNQLTERQATHSRRRPSTITSHNHSPPLAIHQSDPRSLAPPPGYPDPTSDPHPVHISFTNSSSHYQSDSKLSQYNCHTNRLQLLYKQTHRSVNSAERWGSSGSDSRGGNVRENFGGKVHQSAEA